MSKRKNLVNQLVAERYFVWAVVFAVVIGAGVLAQIAVANVLVDSDATATAFQVMPHKPLVPSIHKRK